MNTKALVTLDKAALAIADILPDGLAGAVLAWADSTTDAESKRRADLLRDKSRAVGLFFAWTGKAIETITPVDVKTWQAWLESGRGFETKPLAPATVYAMISRISSFYNWALESPDLAQVIRSNPVTLARPKAPKAYQNESVKALDDDQVTALLSYVKARGDGGSIVGKRDYALLVMYFCTGLRRSEVINLRWGDVKLNGTLTLAVKVKGGLYENREVTSAAVLAAMMDYLTASGRLDTLTPEAPIWTRHDRAGKPGGPLTSHAFVKNLKRYAKKAGVGPIHLHQTRHTYALIVSEESGSMLETQDALGHKNLATTRAYVQRIGVKRDKFSSKVAGRLGL